MMLAYCHPALDAGSSSRSRVKPGMTAWGFSLIEVLIAAALLGLMGVILMSTLTSSLDVRDRAEKISRRHHLIRQAMARLSSEISMAYISTNRNPVSVVVDTQFRGETDQIAFVAFGGFQHRQNAKESGEREISYFIQDGNLMRREKNNPGRQLFNEGKAKLVCPQVDELEFKYWNLQTSAWDSQWKTEGKPIQEATLPSRVQLSMTAKLNEDETEQITTETEIWLTKPILVL